MKFRIIRIHRLFGNWKQYLIWGSLLLLFADLTPAFGVEAPPDPTTFDHLETGFALDGEHDRLACEQCHIGGVFNALPKQCNECHDGVFAVGQPPMHIPTVAACDTCHTPSGFSVRAQVLFDHGTVTGLRCDSCHNGINATGKPPNHILTVWDCDACHGLSSWFVDTFDHRAVEPIISCTAAGCHDASEKSPTHPYTSNNCHVCHNYTGWLPYIHPLNHDEILGTCGASKCHDGSGAGRGKPPTHPLTSNTCEYCHTYPDWSVLNSPFDHAGVMEPSCNRVGCHDVSDRPSTHPQVITESCEICHSSMGSWVVDPGFDHSLILEVNCTASGCHAENDKRPGHPSVMPVDCVECHSIKGQWLPLALPFNHSLTTEALCTASGCHSSVEKGANHPTTTDACQLCHSADSWSPLPQIDHTQI